MKRYLLTSDVVEGISKIPELDFSMIDRTDELDIRAIKDFSNYPELSAKYAAHNTYLIVYGEGTCTSFTCAESQINGFINKGSIL